MSLRSEVPHPFSHPPPTDPALLCQGPPSLPSSSFFPPLPIPLLFTSHLPSFRLYFPSPLFTFQACPSSSSSISQALPPSPAPTFTLSPLFLSSSSPFPALPLRTVCIPAAAPPLPPHPAQFPPPLPCQLFCPVPSQAPRGLASACFQRSRGPSASPAGEGRLQNLFFVKRSEPAPALAGKELPRIFKELRSLGAPPPAGLGL